MSVIIGSARSDENKRYSGGKRGDQRQTSVADYSGEVSLQKFYVHKKGWIILRPKDPNIAKVMAALMHTACNNPHIGYSQSDRDDILRHGVSTYANTNCDCSSLVREIVKEASLNDPGNFNTATEVNALMRTGLFDTAKYTVATPLYEGDILVTKSKGHTAIVVFGKVR